MKIAFVASEMAPFAKTGGLADVIGTLPREIARTQGHEMVVFIPRYKTTDIQKWGLHCVFDHLEIPMGTEKETGRVFSHALEPGVTVYFIDHPEFFLRDGIYGTALGDYPDNDRRFIFFQRAVLETLRAIKFKCDVIHCHDWQTGLIPVYLKTLYAREMFYQKMRSIFTIHNLAFQGNFPPDSLPATGMGWEQYRIEHLEFYGKISFLKGAIVHADMITTVSERYSREIQTKEFGCGMEGVLAKRQDDLTGIVNGIDPRDWDPSTDQEIESRYSLNDLNGKWSNKTTLQRENGFAVDPRNPVLGMVSRLSDQKGMDILIPALEDLLNQGLQIVILGTGEERYHQVLREIAKKNRGRLGVHILFDTKMAKRIYAGSDMFLLPSYYEPCGLGQMIALRFGTIPIVRATGGLADTIQEFNPRTEEGNGFSFDGYSVHALADAVGRALEIYRNQKLWMSLIRNAMDSDFSWANSAKKYVRLYERVKRKAEKS